MNIVSHLPRIEPQKILTRLSPVEKPKTNFKNFFKSLSVAPATERPRRARTFVPHSFWFIGDVHGNLKEYQRILNKIRKVDPACITVQVGDIELDEPKDIGFLGERDFFIQGNHDKYEACHAHKRFLGDYGYKHGLFFVGGAKTPGIGYDKEELSIKDLSNAIDLYEKTKPEIVVTHDCPQSIKEYLFSSKERTRTSEALQEMWEIHAPRVWVFGHHHWSQQEVIEGTDFICVSPLQYRQIKLVWTTGFIDREQASQPIQMTAGKALKRWFGGLNPLK